MIVGYAREVDTLIEKILDFLPHQDAHDIIGYWQDAKKGDNIKVGLWSGAPMLVHKSVFAVGYLDNNLKSYFENNPLKPGYIFPAEPGEDNIFILKRLEDVPTVSYYAMVVYTPEEGTHPTEIKELFADKKLYRILILNTTPYPFGFSIPTKINGTGILKIGDIDPNNLGSLKILATVIKEPSTNISIYFQPILTTINPPPDFEGERWQVVGANSFYGLIFVKVKF